MSLKTKEKKIYGIFLIAASFALTSLTANAENQQSSLKGNVNSGAEVYNSVCKGCHGVSIAPTLRGIIGRPAASVASFTGYSEALKAKQLTWTNETLDAFLASPSNYVPGTLMVQAIPDPQKRADLIAFLATLPPPR